MVMVDETVDNLVLRQLLSRRRELLGYIRALVRDWDAAEDVFQEVCVIVLNKRDALVAGDGLKAYFRTTARHAALALLEKRGRAPATLSPELLDAFERAWSRAPSEQSSAKMELLQDCVRQLPPRSRQLLALRYEAQLTGQALGDKIGSTAESAYVALSRIHRALKNCVTQRSMTGGGFEA
jgi:RNA polymerase sigma-70 factor (ECF subfamily)